MVSDLQKCASVNCWQGGGGGGVGGRVLLGILDEGVPPGSPHPDPVSDQKMSFSRPVFRPDLQNPYPFN